MSARPRPCAPTARVYQAAVFNYCEETKTVFAIGADLDAAVKMAIANHSRGRVEEVS
jgi:hypothetical protein